MAVASASCLARLFMLLFNFYHRDVLFYLRSEKIIRGAL